MYETAAGAGKRVQALGGAKNHMIVLPDADLDQAADAAVSAGYGSAGERCMAISVVVAVGSIGDDLVEASQSHPRPEGGRRGGSRAPTWAPSSRLRIATGRSLVDQGEADGATVVVDGRTLDPPRTDADGFWFGPRPSTTSQTAMSIYRDEIFGPVSPSCGPTPTTTPSNW